VVVLRRRGRCAVVSACCRWLRDCEMKMRIGGVRI
jgi:hypothetical protein